jgi:uncharacterized sulfatase
VVFSGRERHSSSRFNTLGYPQRCIRSGRYLLIHNLKPERWPAGPARKLVGKPGSPLGPEDGGFHDIDACPSLSFLIEKQHDPEIGKFFHLAVDRRPEYELYDVAADPGCVNDLSGQPGLLTKIHEDLVAQLEAELRKTGDPRIVGDGDVFETYPRYSGIRWFPQPDWAKKTPASIPSQPWLEAIRNRRN